MSKNNSIFKLIAALFLLFLIQVQSSATVLKSIHFHQGLPISSVNLELGSLVVLFSNQVFPVLLEKKESASGTVEHRYLLPQLSVVDESVKKMLGKTQQGIDNAYQFRFDKVEKPLQGVQLTVSYNPELVTFGYETVVSSAVLPGYVFRFTNARLQKEIVQQVHKEPVIKTSFLKKKPCVVIDPGHGGSDSGALSVHGVEEKKIVLQISKKVSNILSLRGYDTVLTRSSDNTVPLTGRTALANTVGADLFVSIHANAAHNSQAEGIETFFYPYAEAKSMAGDRGALLNSYLSKKMEHSRGLASFIQLNLCSAINTFQDMRSSVVDRGVKTAPFQVLIGAAQPAVLVEVGFLSNHRESLLLSSLVFCNIVAKGIADGVFAYFNHGLQSV